MTWGEAWGHLIGVLVHLVAACAACVVLGRDLGSWRLESASYPVLRILVVVLGAAVAVGWLFGWL